MSSCSVVSASPCLRQPALAILHGLLVVLGLFMLLPLSAQASTLQSHSYVWNDLGQMASDTDANGKTTNYTYDAKGNRLSSIDPLGRATCYSYDALDRLISVAGPLAPSVACTSSNKSPVTSYSYDALDHLVTVTDPLGHNTSYTYNGLDQLLSQTSPDTGTSNFSYDDSINLTQSTDAMGQLTYAFYDSLGRAGQVSYADGRSIVYDFDDGPYSNGRLSNVSDYLASIGWGTYLSRLSWTYDIHGRVLTRTQNIAATATTPPQAWVLTYSYNSQGQLTQLTYPSGLIVTYTYDSQGRVQSISQNGHIVLSNITYRPFGGIAGWTWANGTTHQRTYDQNGNLSTLSVANTSLIFSYDDVQRLVQSQDISNSATQNFSYDNQDRLSNYVGLNSTRAWTYDANGNRRTQSISSATDNYVLASSSNRLSSLTPSGSGTKTYTYDANGQVTSDGVNTYTYDARKRLASITHSSVTTGYTLNPLGQRIGKTRSGSTLANYIYDDEGHLLAETDSNGLIAKEYLYLGDLPVATSVGATVPGSGGVVLNPISNTTPYWAIQANPTLPTSGSSPTGVFAFGDTYGQITLDTSQTVCSQACIKVSNTNNGSNPDSYPVVHGTVRFTTQSQRFHYEITTTTTPAGGWRQLTVGVQNSPTQSSGQARRVYFTVIGSVAYVEYIDGHTVGSDGVYVPQVRVNLNYPIQDNQSYVVEFDTSPGNCTLYLFPKGGTRAQGVSYSVNLDWSAGGNSYASEHYALVIGLGYTGNTHIPTTMYLTNVTISTIGSRTLYNIHSDQLGTPRQITTSDSSNSLVWRWDSEPFGSMVPNQDPMSTGTPFVFNLRFPGQYFDSESGLSYNYFRDYNAGTGRYVESDPTGLGGGLNTFAYADGNPVSGIDPLGLDTYVTIWQPVGWGESSFGHVSTDVNGKTYSFGPGGMTVMPTPDYVKKNSFRDGMAVKLGLTPNQEDSLKKCLSQPRAKYNFATNNCGTPVQKCLGGIGIDTGNQHFPVSLGNTLLNMSVADGVKEFHPTNPSNGRSAPWAR